MSVRNSGVNRTVSEETQDWVANVQISLSHGGETFGTTATDVPCGKDGIPAEAAVDRLRASVEDIEGKIKKLQN